MHMCVKEIVMTSSEEVDTSLSGSNDTGSSSVAYGGKYMLVKKFPKRAPDWRLEHLAEICIFYDEEATELKKFMTKLRKLKCVVRSGLSEMPKISHAFIKNTKEVWNFSYVFQKETGEEKWDVRDEIERATREFEEKENDIMEDIKSNGSNNWKRLFFGWKINLFEFWRQFSMVLERLGGATEKRFKHLFMAFSRIFFLSPEPGEAFIENMIIKDTVVRGSPEVRFKTFQDKILKVFIVTEVEPYDAFEGSYKTETFTYKNMAKKILGQHGIELLMERKGSFFFPYVVGFLCIGTHVILTYLYIDEAHFHQIVEKGRVNKSCKATISYTRPYDFMDTNDREEILESFFWFGFVQSNAYQFKWK
ncbi:uncharacterized protein LOC133192510 [Saccostrea echinata]|uniref:uncharacterized protein LOC133192510 n=1 Tax=Saccostrea echinata TaxID=191078 RepID=UPI002A7FB6C7|nr:uncharacterized protein LOC133192510 [Saccostrea echinata]